MPWQSAPALAQDACKPGTTKRIAFMLKQQTAFRYLNADIPFFKKTAEAAGYEVIVQSAENDAQKQIGQAENVITQGVDAIVIQPVDFNVAAGIAEMATKAGIPLASYDDLILGAKQAGYIGRDPKDGGAEAARAVVAKVPKGNYVLIGGDAGQTGSTLMQQGYRDVLEPLAAKGDIKIVMDQFTPGWKTEPAQANAENALTAKTTRSMPSWFPMTACRSACCRQSRPQGSRRAPSRSPDRTWSSRPRRRLSRAGSSAASGRRLTKWRLPAPTPLSPWRNAKTSAPRPLPTTGPAKFPG